MTPKEKTLLRHFQRLNQTDAGTLLAFAEFLAGRSEPELAVPTDPVIVPRPEVESVVAAIRRLTTSYPMLDKGAVLHETSALMSAHVMQGRAATDVIDDLEALFQRHFSQHTAKVGQDV